MPNFKSSICKLFLKMEIKQKPAKLIELYIKPSHHSHILGSKMIPELVSKDEIFNRYCGRVSWKNIVQCVEPR